MKKVLVVDDTSEIRMVITETLKFYGFATLAAEDGLSAIEIAKAQSPDLIICDVNMPNLDGYATLTAIRQDPFTATIPFIFLTGAADKLNMRRGMELGADDYLTKPFTHKELLAAVNTRLEKQAEIKRQTDQKLEELRGNITLALPHELRTPLNGIMGLAAILMEDYATLGPQEVLESARLIHQSAERLHHLIENFLIYTQIELMATDSKKLGLASSGDPVAVVEVIVESVQRIASLCGRQDDLSLNVAPARVLLPVENLRKIIEELVDNAFKFSQPGDRVVVTGSVIDNLFNLSIEDYGRGMTPEQIAKVGPHMQFERKIFEQQGAGLGLIIAKRLTELHGGDWSLQSTPGYRTLVHISFALAS